MSRARALSTARKTTTRTSRRRSTPLRPSHRARVSTTLVWLSLSQDRVLALGSKCVCLEDEGLSKKKNAVPPRKGDQESLSIGKGAAGARAARPQRAERPSRRPKGLRFSSLSTSTNKPQQKKSPHPVLLLALDLAHLSVQLVLDLDVQVARVARVWATSERPPHRLSLFDDQ